MAAVDTSKSAVPPRTFRKDSPDLTGREFDRLTVLKFAGRNKNYLLMWECKCECGAITHATSHALTRGHKRSCGCLASDVTRDRSITHSMTHTPTYASWRAMRDRCLRESATGYENYGGRGITICERWNSFELFVEDMGVRPSKAYQIERENNDGNYEPSNCRWATRKQQARNRRSNRIVSHDGESLTIAEWGERSGIGTQRLLQRLRSGWSFGDAITKPIAPRS